MVQPKTFNEKIQYIKFFRRHPLMPLYSDKYKVRQVLADRGLSDTLVKLYGVYDHVHEIDFDALPPSFVIKVNHDSGGVFIVRDKSSEDLTRLKERLSSKLGYPYIHGVINGEWQYLHIAPKIVVEEYLEDESGHLLDYKVHCFEGKPEIIHVDIDRFSNHTRKFYSKNWRPLDFTVGYPKSEKDLLKPKNLERMLSIASVLSRGFHYCRVDLYEAHGKLYFGEVTFFHGNGMEWFEPKEYDLSVGSLIRL